MQYGHDPYIETIKPSVYREEALGKFEDRTPLMNYPRKCTRLAIFNYMLFHFPQKFDEPIPTRSNVSFASDGYAARAESNTSRKLILERAFTK